jgi:hypothetical protein
VRQCATARQCAVVQAVVCGNARGCVQLSGSAAVCGSARGSVRGSVRAAVRGSARGSARGSVRQCGSVWQCSSTTISLRVSSISEAQEVGSSCAICASYNTVCHQSARRSLRAGDACCAIVASISEV